MPEASVEEAFQAKLEFVKNWTTGGKKTTTDEKLKCYGLYKQITEGDVSTERPGFLSFEARAKWDAWKSREGLAKEEAMAAYIAEVDVRRFVVRSMPHLSVPQAQHAKYGD